MTLLGKLFWAVTTISVLGCQVSKQTIGDTALKVRWTSALTLNSLEEIDQRLASPWEDPLDVSRFSGQPETAVITDCLSYFDLTGQGFESTPFKSQLVLGADCHALRALSKAVPAQRTYLVGLQLDENVINYLPPDLSLVISKDDAQKVAVANKEELSWREFEPISRVTPENDDTVLVEGDNWGVRIQVYAFGDFNDDGLEDILVKTHGWLKEGTYVATRLLVLTRSQAGGRLKLVAESDLTK